MLTRIKAAILVASIPIVGFIAAGCSGGTLLAPTPRDGGYYQEGSYNGSDGYNGNEVYGGPTVYGGPAVYGGNGGYYNNDGRDRRDDRGERGRVEGGREAQQAAPAVREGGREAQRSAPAVRQGEPVKKEEHDGHK